MLHSYFNAKSENNIFICRSFDVNPQALEYNDQESESFVSLLFKKKLKVQNIKTKSLCYLLVFVVNLNSFTQNYLSIKVKMYYGVWIKIKYKLSDKTCVGTTAICLISTSVSHSSVSSNILKMAQQEGWDIKSVFVFVFIVYLCEKLRNKERGGYRLVDGDDQSVGLPADVGGVGVQQEGTHKAGQ